MRSLLAGFTTRGRSFLAAGAAAAICGLALGERDLVRVGALIFLLPLLSALGAGRTRYRLGCLRQLTPGRVPAGQAVHVNLRIENVSKLPTGLLLAEDDVPYSLGGRPRFVLERIEGGGVREFDYPLRSDVRGKFTVGPLRLRVADAFGLVELGRSFNTRSTLVVSPKVVPLPVTAVPGSWHGDGEGRARVAAAAGEDDPAPRPYRDGDELRRVHWRSTARYGELMVRREEQQWRNHAVLLLDTRRGAHTGSGMSSSFEFAVSAAASIGVHLAMQGFAGQLVTDTGAVTGGGSFEDVLLDSLAVVKPSGGTDLGPGLATVTPQASGLFVVVARPLGRSGQEPGGRPPGRHAGARPAPGRLDLGGGAAAGRRPGRHGRCQLRAHRGRLAGDDGARGYPAGGGVGAAASASGDQAGRQRPPRAGGGAVNRRLTVTAALASAAASTGLFPLIVGGKWFWGGLGAIILMAAIGTATRLPAARALPAAVCLLAALAGLLLYLNVLYSAKSSFGHLLPTGASLAQLWRLTVQGLDDTQRLASPVPALRGIELIATAGIGLVAALTDLIAVRLRRCALAGLPLLVLFSVPVATGAGNDVLGDAIVFCLGMAGYLALLSADGQERLRLWGRLVTPWNTRPGEPAEELGSGPSTRALAASGRRIGLAAVVAALFVPLLIPSLHAHKIFPSNHTVPGTGTGPGHGRGGPDPLVLMNRQLLQSRPTVVLTYHTTDQNPQYLQMFVLGNLTNTGWTMSLAGKGALPAGSAGALPPIPGNPGGRWPAAHTTIQIHPGALSGDAFLPVPYAPRDLDSPGAWLADPGTLMLYTDSSQSMSGLKYTVTSLDVNPSATDELNKPLAPGAMRQYLAVPPAYKSLTRQARQIVKNAAGPGAEAAALESYFISGRFKYSLNPGGPGGAAGVKYFLEKSRTGYCQQFAFAMAVLARLLGIPARVVVGYTAGTGTGNGTYTVETSDAHAWPELYFRGFGWLRMEPTPAGRAPGQGTAFAPAYSLPPSFAGHPGAGSAGPPTHAGLAGPGRRLRPAPGGFGRKGGDPVGTGGAATGRGHGAGGASALLIALAALLAVALITPRAARSLIRRRRWLTAHSDAALAHAAWSELLDDLADYGIRRRPGQTPRAVAKSVTALLRLPEPGRQALLRITQAEEQASYARQPSPSGALRADVVTVRSAISGSVTKSARWRARLLPASAVDRTRLALSHALDVFGWLEVATARIRHRLLRERPADWG